MRHKPQHPRPLLLLLTLLALIASGLALTAPAQAAPQAPELLSQGRPALASSAEGAGLSASAAVDGDLTGTRWASAWSDPEWIQVDLGAAATISRVVLKWESAYGKDYRIETSDNASSWTTVRTTANGTGGTEDLQVSGTGRYVRVYGTARGTGYGYSLWEFQVYGTPGSGGGSGGGTVRVTGSQGNWQLTVDGAPYQVKGLTWGPAVADAARYLPDVKSMGVNTIRTWGTDGTTKPLLDAAAANGIRVIAGFWLQPGGGPGSGGCVDYVTDTTYKNNMMTEFLRWVDAYRDHPGVLMWDVGNESVLGMQNCYGGTQLEQERNAYTAFVNDVARQIHAHDPNHPVTSTDAWTGAWPYYKANAPDLDLYAVNSYGDVCNVQRNWQDGGYTKPYILTEAGPPGEWEVADDANGVPDEPADTTKADGYTKAWNCITAHRGVALGATLFHYGVEDDFGGIWFNLLPGGLKRLSYYTVKKAYGGTGTDNTPPVISNLTVTGATAVPAGGTFRVHADVRDPEGDPLTYQVLVNSNYVDQSKALAPAPFSNLGGSFDVTAPDRLGVWKVYLKATDGKGNVGIETKSYRVVPPPVNGTNVARGRPATASTFQPGSGDCPCPAANATDGNLATRWASDWSDPQWIQVDLGRQAAIKHIQLVWEAAYGKAYEIQTSADGQNWSSAYSTTTGNGGVDGVNLTRTARYVKLNLTQRGTGYGYSLYELGVYE